MSAASKENALITGAQTDTSLNQSLLGFVWSKPTRGYKQTLLLLSGGVGALLLSLFLLLWQGVGVWGNNHPVGWGFDIINFVWWIGIGHAGTLISAILLLFQQKWRTSINRAAEAMTLFAVVCALMYPTFHTGRPWFDWWMLPYPSTLGVGPQFKSPLLWDVFAIATYGTVSLLFWYVGLIPDLAALRDGSKSKAARLAYGVFALGWRGSGRHWSHWKLGYLLLAGLSTPLVLSVHTIVSFDFAVSHIPGWHSAIFPPYFVAGAVFSGFAMVVSLMIPARKFMKLEHVITLTHLENMNKVILLTGLIVSYGYAMEHFTAWYSGSEYEWTTFFETRTKGPYAPLYWAMWFCNLIVPQVFWVKKWRRSLPVMFTVAILVNIGMWLERFVIIVISLHRDFLPSSWAMYYPTPADLAMFLGSIAFFLTAFMLFCKFLPAVAVAEVKEQNHAEHVKGPA
ncbi:MAG: polysulfide reductase NrfD [Myxococcaceae bacterium]|nr:polysulfide reductase NrfD [Myxococcaceae bacterium]